MADADPMQRLHAALEGRYDIERELGEGGTATVYLARDEKHDRHVALKVLKPELAAVMGAERFVSEIRTTANLQHPNILPLFDSGKAGGLLYFAMPYVEGESLRDRLDREHQLPVDEAVTIACDMAEALDYAHRQGVIHRDIKPANVLLTEGRPVISDFGIALAMQAGGGSRLTETGLSLGTPHYMSPEQATGDLEVGPAADIWALGCVLYEILTGEPPFTGSTPQAVLGRIITEPAPSAGKERRAVASHVDAVIAKALEKLPADRFAKAEDLRRALTDPSFRHGEQPVDDPGRPFLKGVASGAAVAAALALALLPGWGDESSEPRRLLHLEVPIPEAQAVVPDLLHNVSPRIAMSPDGESFVYAGLVDGDESLDSRLYRRRFDQLVAQPIPGTEGGASPFFSPDGRWLAFFRIGGLMRVPAEGGTALTVVEFASSGMWGGWWGGNDTIYFRPSGPNALWQVPADGGAPSRVQQLPRSTFHAPLPGGRGILFSAQDEEPPHVSVRTPVGEVKPLVRARAGRYADGHLLLWRPAAGPGSGSLLAAPFDLEALELAAPPVPILEQDIALTSYGGGFRVSEGGTLIYIRPPQGATASSLVWVDRAGREEPVCAGVGGGAPRISPDGSAVAVNGVRVIDVGDCTVQEITDGGRAPAWSPDGQRLAFAGVNGLEVAGADGGGPETVLYEAGDAISSVWSPNEGAIYFAETRPRADGARVIANKVVGAEIELLRLDLATGTVDPLSDSNSEAVMMTLPTLSPDGAWIALGEWDGLQREIHVARLSDDGLLDKRRVVADGAYAPVWSRAGGELFFRRGSAVVSLPVATEPTFRVAGQEDTLFVGPYGRTSPSVSQMFDYDPGRERFIMVRDNEVRPSVRVVLNWRELQR